MAEVVETYGNYSVTYTVENNYATIKVVDLSTSLILSIKGAEVNRNFDFTFLASSVLGSLIKERNDLDDSLFDVTTNIRREQDFLLNTPNLEPDIIAFAEQSIAQQRELAVRKQQELDDLNDAIQSINFTGDGILRQLRGPITPAVAATPEIVVDRAPTVTETPTQVITNTNGVDVVVDKPNIADNPNIPGSIDASAANTGQPDPAVSDTTEGDEIVVTANPKRPPAAQAQWGPAKDLRAKLRVPAEYITPGTPSAGPSDIIYKNAGILFPYTPTISVDNKAEYSQQTPVHSNFAQYFYKNSSVGPISVTAKFTVQNEFEGAVLLGTIHLLRSLTKMRFGDDPYAGSPPPVCRFDGYGDYMLYNVPVAVSNWRHEIPEGVDFITVGRPGSSTMYGHSMVPVLSSITLELTIMYSRREMLAHNIPDWLSGNLRYKGYL